MTVSKGLYASYPSLNGKVVFVTGGASGIGASIVQAFSRQGAKVALVDKDERAAAELCSRLAKEGLDLPHVSIGDVRQVEIIKETIVEIRQKLGPIQVLINNVGDDQRHLINDVDEQYWDASLAVNLRPHFFAAQACVEDMKNLRSGSIINLGSNASLLGIDGYPLYLTAKAAIIGLTKALARDMGEHGIRVNCVVPGWVMTDKQKQKWLTPAAEKELLEQQCLKRTINPEDVARLCLFLGADDSELITHQVHVIDAGRA